MRDFSDFVNEEEKEAYFKAGHQLQFSYQTEKTQEKGLK